MKNKTFLKYFLLFFILAVVMVTCSYFFYLYYYAPIKIYNMPTDIEVSNSSYGFNIDPDAMHFGMVKVNENMTGVAVRGFYVNNNYDKNVRVIILDDNSTIIQWITLDKYDFILKKNESIRINASIVVPNGTSTGFYNGSYIIYIYPYFGEIENNNLNITDNVLMNITNTINVNYSHTNVTN